MSESNYNKVQTINHNGWEIEVWLNTHNDKYTFDCKSRHLRSNNTANGFDGSFAQAQDAIANIKTAIDVFLAETPTNYQELADVIEKSLIWTGYEDCHISPNTLQIIVENFIKARST